MKLLIASDIHGDLDSAKLVFSAFEKECCDKIILLGDLLYHGPRNDLPKSYAPKEVISLLNQNKSNIIAVRGNCDTEVDQMVLNFPILADYLCLHTDNLTMYLTHGHKYNIDSPLAFCRGDILLHGHTHIPTCKEFGESNLYLNPGSPSIPKGGYPGSYMIYENRCFTVKDFDGKIIFTKQL